MALLNYKMETFAKLVPPYMLEIEFQFQLRIRSHLLKKSFVENFIFCAARF